MSEERAEYSKSASTTEDEIMKVRQAIEILRSIKINDRHVSNAIDNSIILLTRSISHIYDWYYKKSGRE